MAAARISRPVLFLIVCLCYSLMLSIHVPHATSLSFSFNFSTSGDPFTGPGAQLRREGDAKFSSPQIELTKNDITGDNERSIGRVSYAQPVPLWDNVTGELSSFNTNFSFEIRPAATTTACPVTGDGMAFFLGHYPSMIPTNNYSLGRNIGLFNDSSNMNATGDARIVAVEFDTFENSGVDTSNSHVGIDVNSIISVAYKNTSTPGRNLTSGTTMTAEINYDNSTETLAVTLWINGTSYRVNAIVDMRSCFPEEVAVGFAAATGSCIEVHRLLSWSFRSTLDSKRPPAPPPQPPAPVVNPNDNKRIHRLKVALASAVPTLIVLACAVFGFRTWRQRTRNKHQRGTSESDSEEESVELGGGLAAGPRRYPYRELADATGNFAEQEKLGRGGFGNVYRGRLPGGDMHQHQLVAIKLFSSETSSQGKKEFEAEVKIISRLRHRNLVQLLGWCDSHKGLLLVYELVELGSLDKHLYSSERLLTWPERYKIIVGLGRALQYLHTDCQQCVVHGDIKPGNILLDSSYDTKLADFGLARLIEHGTGSRTTRVVAGTAGYIDPEFVNTRKPSTESDVYSFGIVLLEIVSGRPPVMEQSEKVILLLRWVWDLYGRSAVLEAADEQLSGDASLHDRQMERALVVGLWCAHPDRSQRPSVAQAMHVLQSADAPLPALPPQMYNNAPNLEIAAHAYRVLSIENPGGTFHSSTTTGTTHSSDSSATALLRSSRDLA